MEKYFHLDIYGQLGIYSRKDQSKPQRVNLKCEKIFTSSISDCSFFYGKTQNFLDINFDILFIGK